MAKRSSVELDPRLSRILRKVGAEKLVADMTPQEKHQARSFRIRMQIAEFLMENEGSSWVTLSDLFNRAANESGCSSVTAARWVNQLTAPGTAHKLVETGKVIMIMRRDREPYP